MAYSRQVYKREAEAAEKDEKAVETSTFGTHFFNHKQHTTATRK